MGNNKILLAGFLGAVTLFLLGFIVYGMLLSEFMAQNAGAPGVNKNIEEMSFGWIIVSNLAGGFLLAVIFGKYANIHTAMAGIQAGALIGLLMAMSVDTALYSTTHLYNITAMFTDIIMWTFMSAITGAVVGATLGVSRKATIA